MEYNEDFYGGLFGMSSVPPPPPPPGLSFPAKHPTTTSVPHAGFSVLPKHTTDEIDTMLGSDGDSFFSSNPYVCNHSNTTRSVTDNSLHSMPHVMSQSINIYDDIHTIEKTTSMLLHNSNNNNSSSTTKNRRALASDQILLCAASLLQNQAQYDSKYGTTNSNTVTGQRKPFVYTEFNAIPSLPLELGGICHPTQISPDTQKRELVIENELSDDIVAGIVPTIYTIFR